MPKLPPKEKSCPTIRHYSIADVLEYQVPSREGDLIFISAKLRDEIVAELRRYEELVAEMERENGKNHETE